MMIGIARRRLGKLIRHPGLVIATVGFLVRLVWVVVIPPLDAPDEPAHLKAIMQVREQHTLPQVHYALGNSVIKIASSSGDSDTYVANLLSTLPVNDEYVQLPYKSVQPPLYYLAAGLAAQLAPAIPQVVVYIGRLVAVLFGVGTVYFCWLATRELIPGAPILAIASAGVVALLPEICFTSAHAANDSAINLSATAAFYVWIRGLRHPEFDPYLFGAGAMLGLAFLSKLTAGVLIPGLVLLVIFRMFQARPSVTGFHNWLKRCLYMSAGAILGLILVSGWWFVRNVFVYGEPSGTALEVRMVSGEFIKADFSKPETAGDLVRYTLESLWGRFGWNDITLPQNVYHFCNIAALTLLCLSVVAGISILGLWITRRQPFNLVACQASLIFLAIGLTLLIGFVQYNAKIAYQPQARYFFILLLPGTLLLTGGLYAFAWIRIVRVLAVAALLSGLAVLNGSAIATIYRAGPARGGVRSRTTWRSPGRRRIDFVSARALDFVNMG
jgi:4-amino-4-deoxy-L-arabinose transferase-like glycosyltransferase